MNKRKILSSLQILLYRSYFIIIIMEEWNTAMAMFIRHNHTVVVNTPFPSQPNLPPFSTNKTIQRASRRRVRPMESHPRRGWRPFHPTERPSPPRAPRRMVASSHYIHTYT